MYIINDYISLDEIFVKEISIEEVEAITSLHIEEHFNNTKADIANRFRGIYKLTASKTGYCSMNDYSSSKEACSTFTVSRKLVNKYIVAILNKETTKKQIYNFCKYWSHESRCLPITIRTHDSLGVINYKKGDWDPAKGIPATSLTIVIQVVPSGNKQNAGYNIVTAYPS